MHPSEAVPTGCQSRLHGGVGLAVLTSTGERLRSTRAEVGGLFVCLFLMHPSEAVPTGCQSRLHGGVGLAVLISTGERLRSTRAEVGGLFVCLFLMHPSEAVSTGCQLRLHGGVGLAVLIPTGERLHTEHARRGGRPSPERTAAVFEDIGRRSGARPAPLFRRAELRGGSYEHLLSWGGYRSKWACAPLEGGRVVTKLWAAT